jgi:acyl-CoA synthetase (AMP-forming)/AMP-acid ligase II
VEVLVAEPEHLLGDDDPVAGILDAFSAQYLARAVTASGAQVSVNTLRCSTAPASMMSPVSCIRRANTGPRRWKNKCRLPSAGPRKRVAGIPIRVSRAVRTARRGHATVCPSEVERHCGPWRASMARSSPTSEAIVVTGWVPTVWLLLGSDDDVPRGSSGKVDVRRLRELLTETQTLEVGR